MRKVETVEWLEPWAAVEDAEKQQLTQELRREIIVGHLLHNVPVVVVGRSIASDDIVVLLSQYQFQYAVVHLTWQPNTDAKWPLTTLFADWEAFTRQRMGIDNAKY